MPIADWPALRVGTKTELRLSGRGSGFADMKTPSPLVGVAFEKYRRADPKWALFVLEETRVEMLGAISPESLAREGFETLAEFRRYWRDHRNRPGVFKPLSKVVVLRLRLWRPEDRAVMADALLERLYGQYLP